MKKLTLNVHKENYGICKLHKEAPVPEWVEGIFTSITRTANELSIICLEEKIPKEIKCEKGWRVIEIVGQLEFSLVGVLASLLTPLADAGISVFALSTFNTDYLLIKEKDIDATVKILEASGHIVAE